MPPLITGVPDPLLDINKPGRSVDWKTMRDDIQDLQDQILALGGVLTGQDIREHFMGTALDTDVWDVTGATITIGGEHSGLFRPGADAVLEATTKKLRVLKSHEYIAFMETRVRMGGGGTGNQSAAFGWNDDGLTAGTLVTDVTDFAGVYWNNTNVEWTARTAETAGGNSEFIITTTETNWNTIRLELTCSATAGNRNMKVYLAGSLVSTLATDANIPAEVLTPFIGATDLGGGVTELDCDYILFGFMNTPVAA